MAGGAFGDRRTIGAPRAANTRGSPAPHKGTAGGTAESYRRRRRHRSYRRRSARFGFGFFGYGGIACIREAWRNADDHGRSRGNSLALAGGARVGRGGSILGAAVFFFGWTWSESARHA